MIDACKVGLCALYDTGGGVFGLVVGVAIAAAIILLIRRRRGRSDDD